MLESIKYATISNIYVKDLIFFDEEKIDDLIVMCNNYGITYLPSRDRKSCYKLINGSFILSELTENLICKPYDRIFDEKTLEKFEMGSHDEVMFVLDNEKIKGVVHIVDYNADFINYEFFKATFLFEKMLRKLLTRMNESNETIIEWFKIKSVKSAHWKNRLEVCLPLDEKKLKEQILKRKECNPFQTFYLNDLLSFAFSKKYVSQEFRNNRKAITEIRNWVSHSKDLTHKSKIESQPLYKLDGIKDFVSNANIFFNCYEELEELLLAKIIK